MKSKAVAASRRAIRPSSQVLTVPGGAVQVADDGDVGAFIGLAVVILALSLLLWKLGMWFALRRTDQRSG